MKKPKPPLSNHTLRMIDAVFAADRSVLDTQTSMVLIAYARRLSNEDWLAWPGVASIARWTKMSERTVQERRSYILSMTEPRIAREAEHPPRSRQGNRRWRGRPPKCLAFDIEALESLARAGDEAVKNLYPAPVLQAARAGKPGDLPERGAGNFPARRAG